MSAKINKLNDANQAAEHKGRYMVGSIHKRTNQVSFSPEPATHLSAGAAVSEATRLAQLDRDKKFVIVQIVSFVSTNDILIE